MRTSPFQTLLLIAFTLVLGASSASAQVNWWRTDGNNAFTLEFSKVHFNGEAADELFDFFNTVGFVGGQFEFTPSLSVVLELPFATWDANATLLNGLEEPWWPDGELQIGNPYLGIEHWDASELPLYRVGLRVPMASEEKEYASEIGVFGAYDRFEAFLPDIWTLSAAAGIRKNSSPDNAFAGQFLLGPTFMVPTDGDAELFVDYQGLIGYSGQLAKLGVSLHGRALVTEDVESFGDRFVHELAATAGLRFGQFEPGIHFKYNLDEDLREVIDYSYGINLEVVIP